MEEKERIVFLFWKKKKKKRTLTIRWPRPKLKDVRVGGGGKKEPK